MTWKRGEAPQNKFWRGKAPNNQYNSFILSELYNLRVDEVHVLIIIFFFIFSLFSPRRGRFCNSSITLRHFRQPPFLIFGSFLKEIHQKLHISTPHAFFPANIPLSIQICIRFFALIKRISDYCDSSSANRKGGWLTHPSQFKRAKKKEKKKKHSKQQTTKFIIPWWLEKLSTRFEHWRIALNVEKTCDFSKNIAKSSTILCISKKLKEIKIISKKMTVIADSVLPKKDKLLLSRRDYATNSLNLRKTK